MEDPIFIVGIGQLGGVFARAFLKIDHPVYPILRSTRLTDAVENYTQPKFVLLAVGIQDLHPLLEELPAVWSDRIGLLQNELLPRDWEAHEIKNPTVSIIWFEKKHRRPVKPLIPSPIYGPQAVLIAKALRALDIPTRILDDKEELTRQLVLKNLYILTANIAGLVGDETVGGLLKNQPKLLKAVFDDVLTVQEVLVGQKLVREALWNDIQNIFEAHPEHGAKGRSALGRLQRILELSEEHGLSIPQLRNIYAEISEG